MFSRKSKSNFSKLDSKEELIEYPCGMVGKKERWHKKTCNVCVNLFKDKKLSRSFISPNTKDRFRKKFRKST